MIDGGIHKIDNPLIFGPWTREAVKEIQNRKVDTRSGGWNKECSEGGTKNAPRVEQRMLRGSIFWLASIANG